MVKFTNLCFQMQFSSLEVLTPAQLTQLTTQQSYISPPPVSPAHCPSCLMTEYHTPWRALGCCAAENTQGTRACSGAQTPEAVWDALHRSLWMLTDLIMSPGLQTLNPAPTSWGAGGLTVGVKGQQH